tara:strand:- start:1246 stop:2502 length:1257 start_codon:yes stop_codon:yes gene_type:complete
MIILKLDNNGNILWIENFKNDNGAVASYSLDIDQSNNIYITGEFGGDVDFDNSSSSDYILSNHSLFVLKLNDNAEFNWVKQVESNDNYLTSCNADIDNSANIYLTGYFEGDSIDFDPGINTVFGNTSNTSLPNADMFLLKLDSNGNYIWVKFFDLLGSDDEFTLIDASIPESIYLNGFFQSDNLDVDPSSNDYFISPTDSDDGLILKLDSSGNFIWSYQIDGDNPSSSDLIYDIEVVNNNIYITGSLNSSSGDTGSAPQLFLRKIDANRDVIWNLEFNGPAEGINLVVSQGVIFVTGLFGGSLDIDPNTSVNNVFTNNQQGYDEHFIISLKDNNVIGIDDYFDLAKFEIFPNPFKENITIQAEDDYGNLKVFDMQGQVVFSEKILSQKQFNLSFLKAGMYTVQLSNKNYTITNKIIKH